MMTGWWFEPSEQYEFVSWDDDIPSIWKNTPDMFQSPPTSWDLLAKPWQQDPGAASNSIPYPASIR